MENPILVKAIHAYTPVNNDELKLAKNDIISVAQKDEGGWWEGTLNGKSGWFPSNYVVELDDLDGSDVVSNGNASTPMTSLEVSASQRIEYKRMVLADLIESENAHIMELQGMWDNYLLPLRNAEILKPTDYDILVGNIPEILQYHSSILVQLKKEQAKSHKDQRVGKLFLEGALKLESVHKTYCSNHPKAIQVLERHNDALKEFMESKGARQPGVLVLIVTLSQPFRRLEKYPTMLQELERHIEENHKDRGDLQRSIEYYKQIDKNCGVIRKQKEMELEVLGGTIKGWEGTDVSLLGEIYHMNLVHIGPDLQPRYFVLFANTLLILTYVPESNSLVYEGKIPVSGILLTNVPDKENTINSFEIAGPMLEPILVRCSSKESKDTWLEQLTRILQLNRFPSFSASPQQSFGHLTPPVQAWNIARLRPAPPFNPFLSDCLRNVTKPKVSKADKSSSTSSLHAGINGNISLPMPPVTNEDDLAVLSIVDAFCTKTRQISASISPAIIVKPALPSGPEKLPRTLTDLVMLLGEEVRSLKAAMVKVSGQLEEEQKARKTMHNLITTNCKTCGCVSYKP
ncbi:unnamed protein product [Allacma fusca]|uniref:Rho guanine nucleotide exchange factor 7 n=1 Tax=Allacma fusca TaxID=39272 RepID=A0A8J2NZU3_9HEXA|nr:unnamed protein product [Allacma fusca]